MKQYRDDALRAEIARHQAALIRDEEALEQESRDFRNAKDSYEKTVDAYRQKIARHRFVIAALEKALAEQGAASS